MPLRYIVMTFAFPPTQNALIRKWQIFIKIEFSLKIRKCVFVFCSSRHHVKVIFQNDGLSKPRFPTYGRNNTAETIIHYKTSASSPTRTRTDVRDTKLTLRNIYFTSTVFCLAVCFFVCVLIWSDFSESSLPGYPIHIQANRGQEIHCRRI